VKRITVFVFVVGIVFLFSQNVFSQTSEDLKPIKEEIESLKKGQAGIKKDLQEIKKLLERAPSRAPQKQEFKEAVINNIDDDPFKGDKNAKITILEFSDYQ
jgi:protein-disulfide isomerase